MSTLANKIQDVFNEPGCGVNQGKSEKERKKGCTKPLQPGGAAGGCAFDGAKIALQPITDVAHLVHGPIACEGHSWDNRNCGSSGSKLYRMSFTTDMSEQDVIFGGEKRLWRAIREIVEKYDPPAIFVYQTCVPAMTGDHIEAVCKKASEKFGKPCIPVNVPGFVGAKNARQQARGRGAARLRDRHAGTRIHHALRPQHHRRIQRRGRAVAGEAAPRRAWRPHPRLHLGRREIQGSGQLAPRQGRDDGLLARHDQRRAQDGGALRHPLFRGLVLRHRRHERQLCARSRGCLSSAARRTT